MYGTRMHMHSHRTHTHPYTCTAVRVHTHMHTHTGPEQAFSQKVTVTGNKLCRTLRNVGLELEFSRSLYSKRAVACSLGTVLLLTSTMRGASSNRALIPHTKQDPTTKFVKSSSCFKKRHYLGPTERMPPVEAELLSTCTE